MAKTKVTPLQDRLLVRRMDDDAETTEGGIILPDSAKEKPQEGEVIAVGPGKVTDDGKRQKPELSKGDRIMFAKYAGTEVKIDGEDLLIMREDDVLAVVN
ncbi:MAG: co-chaperone GroES [Nitrospinaceae bacterium]|jgi:chaperonin GroES|nr:co-chaperone GroES [Nitrospinaceae bacterium]MBT3432887.1 co-chaperone GroES [Nitrospinaceae bacterium]MBT4093694.1 co-chaperone GroES [Nitrospinaceae bacterium]MBT4432668.1 co-chaperone GroES [Nitrospinaceae bacterium]MBT5369895.1 co-chaperone GroES [Nitrospinaceae bacterium]